jgi:hypothetical protein
MKFSSNVANNITRGTFNLRLVKASFSRAGDILIGTFYELNRLREGFRPRHRFTVKSILGTIVQIPDSVVAHREFVHRVYIDNKPQIDADHWPLGNLIGDALSGAAGNKRRLGGSSENGDDCGDDQPTKRRRLSTGSGSSSAKPGKKKKQKKKAKQMKTKRRRKFQTF